MEIAPFGIEEFFARYEFTVPHTLCASDCETISIDELLDLAGTPLKDLGQLRLSYTETQGGALLREAIAASYERVAPEAIVVLGAPEEGIYITMRALLAPGDEVVVMAPAYQSLRRLAQHICGEENVRLWHVHPEGAHWRAHLEELEDLLTARTKLLIANFPHNPTGYLPSPAEFDALLDLVHRRGVRLFCDEMYRGLENGTAERLPSAADRDEHAVVLSGLSKVHGLPGLRSGWLVVHDEALRQELLNWKNYTTICPPGPSEFLALAAMKAQDTLTRRSQAIVDANLEAADDFFARWSDFFAWRRPQAGPVALVGLNGVSAE
ncbi:MAG TPA: pyridoxal phosphate-dependent aminotransferase, partial [Candidatus Binatia bacterium]|nr:pyridoxal phosphate-dependent aminotransferase [Candidatus Binatia bacterium]